MLGLGLSVWAFLFANLWVAARVAPPDVLWELEDQLGLPGRASIEPLVRRLLVPVTALIAFVAGTRGSGAWDTVIEFRNATAFGRVDPLFGRDLGFYFFELPFWRLLYGWAIALAAGALVLTAAVYVLQRSLVLTARGPRLAAAARTHLLGLGALILVLRAAGFWLDRFDLLYSSRGPVFGASYTDVNAALPVLNVLAVLALLCAAACLVQMSRPGWLFPVAGLVVLIVVWVGGLGLYPSLLQKFSVKPNELRAEGPYIRHNIRMTRHAYGLDRVQEKDFPAEENLNAAALDRNVLTIKNVRLWDHRPLLTTYGQLQEIRTYYKFLDVDNDRYTLNGEYRQVMLSPRELSYRHLPGQEQNWINEHLTYTHGYGLVVGPVNRISPEGLPEFFVKDIPPLTAGFPKITRPEIYYGESGNDYAFVRTQSQELDYPSGDQNVYTKYEGRGGIPVDSFLRKLAFAARFGELKVLLTRDLTSESRIMIYRNIRDRVRQAAPFVRFDRDPYLVVTDDGQLVWMLDGYTASERYPYAQPVRGIGNYIRNSVKVTMDAFHGTLTYYVADPEDPIVRTYAKAFPGLLRPLADMPKDLQAHIRYPEDLFTLQMQMYATYHMEDPQVFYNKEDLWTIPRRTQEGRTATEMEPYYTIMRLPGEAREEFVLLGGLQPEPARQHDRDHGRAGGSPELRPDHRLQLPQAEAGLRAAADRRAHRPGSDHLPAACPLEPAGLACAPRLDAGHPHRPVADLRSAAVSVGHRAGGAARAPARHRGLWQSDRDGAHAGAGARAYFRGAGAGGRASARGAGRGGSPGSAAGRRRRGAALAQPSGMGGVAEEPGGAPPRRLGGLRSGAEAPRGSAASASRGPLGPGAEEERGTQAREHDIRGPGGEEGRQEVGLGERQRHVVHDPVTDRNHDGHADAHRAPAAPG